MWLLFVGWLGTLAVVAEKNFLPCCSENNEFVPYNRHEVPVTADPIEVVYMDDDLVVVDKPASIPVSDLNQ